MSIKTPRKPEPASSTVAERAIIYRCFSCGRERSPHGMCQCGGYSYRQTERAPEIGLETPAASGELKVYAIARRAARTQLSFLNSMFDAKCAAAEGADRLASQEVEPKDSGEPTSPRRRKPGQGGS